MVFRAGGCEYVRIGPGSSGDIQVCGYPYWGSVKNRRWAGVVSLDLGACKQEECLSVHGRRGSWPWPVKDAQAAP